MVGVTSRWVWVLAAVTGVTGCLLVNDFDEVTGGTSAPPGADATTPDDSATPDDAATVDAGFRCADHQQCLTFDEGRLEVDGWNQSNSGNGSMVLDKTLFVSPPAGGRTTFDSTDGGNAPQNGATMDKTLTIDPPGHMRWGFDLNLGDCSLPTGAGVGSITLTSVFPSDQAAFGLILGSNNREQIGHSNRTTNVFTSKALPSPLPRRRWIHLDFDLVVSATSSSMIMFLDGEQIVDAVFPEAPPSRKVLLNLGALSSGRVNACDVAYDNYYFDVVP